MRWSSALWSPRSRRRVASSASRGLAASACALASAWARSASGSTIALTRPSSRAASASNGSASSRNSAARGGAEALRREQRRARLGHEAEVDERHWKARARRGVDEVAVEAQRRADADRRPFDRGDERLVEGRQRADEAARPAISAFEPPRLHRRGEKVADVVAGGEDARRSGRAAARRRSASRLASCERGDQALVHRAGQRVLLLRPRQRDAAEPRPRARPRTNSLMPSPPEWLRKASSAPAPERIERARPGAAVASFSAKKRARPMRPRCVSSPRAARSCAARPALARHAPPSARPNSLQIGRGAGERGSRGRRRAPRA